MSMAATATSRRHLLMGAVVAAAGIPTVQPARAEQADAELLAYGREMDACIHDYKIACAKYRPLWDKLSDRLQSEQPNKDEAAVSFHHRIYNEVGLGALDRQGEHPDKITERSDAPSRAIMAIPATTLTGLAVKARLAKFWASHIWNESDEDADWDHLVLRNLVDAVLELASANSNTMGGTA